MGNANTRNTMISTKYVTRRETGLRHVHHVWFRGSKHVIAKTSGLVHLKHIETLVVLRIRNSRRQVSSHFRCFKHLYFIVFVQIILHTLLLLLHMLILYILKDLQVDTILHIAICSNATFGWRWLWLHVQLLAVSTRHVDHSPLWITRNRLCYRKMTNMRLITAVVTKTINAIYSILKGNVELVVVALVVWWWTWIIWLRLTLSI